MRRATASRPTRILGLSAFYHDSAAALVVDGDLVAAAQEERFTRLKHDASYPKNAVDYVLSEAGLALREVDFVAFYDKPFLTFERLLETYAAFAPRGLKSFCVSMPIWTKDKLFQKQKLLRALDAHEGGFGTPEKLLFAEHHVSHAASAFYPSPFDDAVILTLDGVGEWATTTVAIGQGRKLRLEKEIHFPHSLGLLYSAITYYLGFKVNSGEYKVMGLAPFGEPQYKETILTHLIDLKADGSFRLDQRYFDYAAGLTMTNRRFEALFGRPRRQPETELLTQFHMDMAASVQAVVEDAMLRLTRSLAAEHRIPNLCLAGGVALNCVANGRVVRDGAFEKVWIQPAAGDAGGAVGAALAAYHLDQGRDRPSAAARTAAAPSHDAAADGMRGAYLGPSFDQDDIELRLSAAGAVFETLEEPAMLRAAAEALASGQAVGWFQGRMEFGPRALGNRSILADPRAAEMQKTLNLKVKFRESFRPFAPSVLAEDAADWFEIDRPSPYMLLVADLLPSLRREMTEAEKSLFGIDKLNAPRSSIPAVTHVDYSARLQTVHAHTNPLYHRLLTSFKALTGCPMLVNTSFNIRGEPLVCTPEDAFRCFMGTDLDMLVCGRSVLRKAAQNQRRQHDYRDQFALD